jgi:hypothetical protein
MLSTYFPLPLFYLTQIQSRFFNDFPTPFSYQRVPPPISTPRIKRPRFSIASNSTASEKIPKKTMPIFLSLPLEIHHLIYNLVLHFEESPPTTNEELSTLPLTTTVGSFITSGNRTNRPPPISRGKCNTRHIYNERHNWYLATPPPLTSTALLQTNIQVHTEVWDTVTRLNALSASAIRSTASSETSGSCTPLGLVFRRSRRTSISWTLISGSLVAGGKTGRISGADSRAIGRV